MPNWLWFVPKESRGGREEEGGRREEGGGRRAEGTQASSENVKQNRVSDLQTHTHTEISLPSGHTNDLVD